MADTPPRTGLWHRSSLRTKGLFLIAIPLLPLVVLMGTLLVQAKQNERAADRVSELREKRDATQHLLATSVEAENAIRGYVATGDAEFLGPFNDVMINLVGLARTFKVADVPPAAQDLIEQEYELLLRLRREGATLPPALRDHLLLDAKENMDGLRAALTDHIDRQQSHLEAALATREGLQRRIEVILWVGAVGGLIGGAIGVVLFVREIAARIRLLQEGSRMLGGDEPLPEIRGKDEIARLGTVLEAARLELAHRETLRREAEAEMVRSRDDAERANRAKSEFLSRMSHELRTPLNAILGFAQLLEMDGLDADQKESLRQIVRGGNHLLALINEVLDISRVETGQLSISVEPTALHPVLDETAALVQPLAVAEGVEIRVASAGDDLHVMADRQRLKQIVLNLLSNGIKYNRPGGSVELTVTAADDRVRVAVRDTGHGLDGHQLEQLFQPFERLGVETTGVEGTGLGLALSKGLAEAMGGRIEASSELGVGTTFVLELALAADPAETEPEVIDAQELAAATTGHQVWTVLYVEDNLSNLKLVERILARRSGIRVVSAADGRTGLELAAQHDPDLILLDLNLPDIDGSEVLRRLRAGAHTSAIPVVMVSADATPRQIERFRAAGALDYVTKPLDVQQFLRIVDRALAEAVA